MKIVIAALASLAFATSAFAAVPSAPAARQSPIKIAGQIELANGGARDVGGYSSRNTSKSDKGAADTSATGKKDSWKK